MSDGHIEILRSYQVESCLPLSRSVKNCVFGAFSDDQNSQPNSNSILFHLHFSMSKKVPLL